MGFGIFFEGDLEPGRPSLARRDLALGQVPKAEETGFRDFRRVGGHPAGVDPPGLIDVAELVFGPDLAIGGPVEEME